MDPTIVVALFEAIIGLLGSTAIQGTFAYLGYKKSKGTEAKREDTGKADKKSVIKFKSLEVKAKELNREGKRIQQSTIQVINSYGWLVLALGLLHGIFSIYLQQRYPTDSLRLSYETTFVFFFSVGVAFTTALQKIETTSQPTGDLRRKLKDLREQVTAFRASARKMDGQLAGLEEAIAEAMELSKSKDKQANMSALLPQAAIATAYGLCFLVLAHLVTPHCTG